MPATPSIRNLSGKLRALPNDQRMPVNSAGTRTISPCTLVRSSRLSRSFQPPSNRGLDDRVSITISQYETSITLNRNKRAFIDHVHYFEQRARTIAQSIGLPREGPVYRRNENERHRDPIARSKFSPGSRQGSRPDRAGVGDDRQRSNDGLCLSNQ